MKSALLFLLITFSLLLHAAEGFSPRSACLVIGGVLGDLTGRELKIQRRGRIVMGLFGAAVGASLVKHEDIAVASLCVGTALGLTARKRSDEKNSYIYTKIFCPSVAAVGLIHLANAAQHNLVQKSIGVVAATCIVCRLTRVIINLQKAD